MTLMERPTTSSAMTPAEKRHLGSLEKRIASGLQTFREVGAALLEIRDSRLYRDTHQSFEAYCGERWGLNRVRAYQLMDSARVVAVLGDPSELKNEAQARELASLDPDDAREVWAQVEARVAETGKPVTAAVIRQVKAEVIEPEDGGGGGQSLTDRLVGDMNRLANTYERWQDSAPGRNDVRAVNAAKRKLIEAIR